MANLPPNKPIVPITEADVKPFSANTESVIKTIGSDLNGLQEQVGELNLGLGTLQTQVNNLPQTAPPPGFPRLQFGTAATTHDAIGARVQFPKCFATIPTVVITAWYGGSYSHEPNQAANQSHQHAAITSVSPLGFTFTCQPPYAFAPYNVQVSWIAISA